jgi:phage gp45-like
MMQKLWNLIRTGTIMEHRSGKGAKSKVKLGEEEEGLVFPYIEPFGFTSFPLPGSEAFLFSKGGSYDFTFVMMSADRAREKPSLNAGDSALYASNSTYIATKNDGSVEISCSKGLSIKKDGAELLSLVTQIVEAIDSSSFVGQDKVNNMQLKPLIEKLKKFTS